MLCGDPSTVVHGGESAFAHQHLAWVCEFHEEGGALITKHIKTKRDEVSGTSKSGIAKRHERDGRSSCRN